MIVRIVPSSVALPMFLKGTLKTLVSGPREIMEAERSVAAAEKRLLVAQEKLAKVKRAWKQACDEGSTR
jgi:hypothetical protein